ncbi:MAG: SMP-30/gluconolactonase/LRE family protein [Hyphomonadaceae bacterium]
MKAEPFLRGLNFGEGLRWRAGRFWYSDFYKQQVLSVGADGAPRIELTVADDRPSGLGWLPDGRLLAVSMGKRQILRRERDGRISVHADLAPFTSHHANDMLVDARGDAYVSCFGFDLFAFVSAHGSAALFAEPGPPRAPVLRVSPEGAVSVASEDHLFPNGMALIGKTLIVAECFLPGLTAFDIGPDGALANRRIWARFSKPQPTIVPDGICSDSEGAVWIANSIAREALRIGEGGRILDRVETEQIAFTCALGGADGRDLVIVTAPTAKPEAAAAKARGMLEIARVQTPL